MTLYMLLKTTVTCVIFPLLGRSFSAGRTVSKMAGDQQRCHGDRRQLRPMRRQDRSCCSSSHLADRSCSSSNLTPPPPPPPTSPRALFSPLPDWIPARSYRVMQIEPSIKEEGFMGKEWNFNKEIDRQAVECVGARCGEPLIKFLLKISTIIG